MAFQAPKELINRLEESSKRHSFLSEQISQPDIIANRQEFMKLSREHSELSDLVEKFTDFNSALSAYEQAMELLQNEKDPEMKELAQLDVDELEPKLVDSIKELELLLLPKDPNDEKNILLELRAGVGGDESAIFVGDLYDAYSRLSSKMGWRISLLSASQSEAGGFKEIIASIEGEAVFSKLKFESGVHRVQRVPKTESQGRVHTSTVTVAVLPEAEEVEFEIDSKDLRIDTMRASGAGGQHVNKTDSAVRITHLPTNEVVICQDEKSQHKNKAKAMKVLRSRLLTRAQNEAQEKEAAQRKSQVGGGFRNERIRTYNFPQSRVTDHRINMTSHNIDDVMNGQFLDFIQALNHHYQTLALQEESETN